MKLNIDRVENWSLLYRILKLWVDFTHNFIFYRKVIVTGLENIPKNEPIVLAPNHQNALMDAMIITCTNNWQPVFFARSDIFNNYIATKLFLFLKILPIYRIRDGKEKLKENVKMFQKGVDILKKNKIIVIYPEANHLGKRKLRVVKKGIQRIVFQAEEQNNYKLGVKIIPIGINYENYFNLRSAIRINYGKPISVSDYYDTHKENPQKAFLDLRDKIAKGIKPEIIHINNNVYYETYENIIELYYDKSAKDLKLNEKRFKNHFDITKNIVNKTDKILKNNEEELKDIANLTTEYKSKISKFNIRDWVVKKNRNAGNAILHTLYLIFFFPLFLSGFIANIIPYKIPMIVTKKIRDRNFHSSFHYVIGLLLFPIYYMIIFSFIWKFSDIEWIKYVALLLMPIFGMFAFYYYKSLLKHNGKWRFIFLKKNQRCDMINQRKHIIEKLDNLFQKYN